MKVIYEKANKGNNACKVNVDEHQDKICDIENENEVQEFTAARNTMKKNQALYVTHNQTFAMKNRLNKHIQ